MDANLNSLGFTKNNVVTIYKVLSAILNLGNIEFESSVNNESCSIKNESRKFLCNAAALIMVDELKLEGALIYYTRIVGGQEIKYTLKSCFRYFPLNNIEFEINLHILIHFRSPLTKISAEKARDCVTIGLYNKMFDQIMEQINKHLSSSESQFSIGILDIAGFGKQKL